MLTAKMIPLKSDCVKAAAWLDGRIAIKFPSGRVRFYRATVRTWQELMAASSAGAFYNANLKFRKSVSARPAKKRADARGRRLRASPRAKKLAADSGGMEIGGNFTNEVSFR